MKKKKERSYICMHACVMHALGVRHGTCMCGTKVHACVCNASAQMKTKVRACMCSWLVARLPEISIAGLISLITKVISTAAGLLYYFSCM